MLNKTIFYISIIFVFVQICNSQIEHIQVAHPIYNFLVHFENLGILSHKSLSNLPLQKKEIIDCLKLIRENDNSLSTNLISSLEKYEIEFGIKTPKSKVVFYSNSDSSQVLFSGLISEDEKYVYHNIDSSNEISLKPLAKLDFRTEKIDNKFQSVNLAQFGFRLNGTIENQVGYYLQATNGTILSGDKRIALEDIHLSQNIKLVDLNSDFDFTESHLRYDSKWFYAGIGRETRLIGSGMNQRLFVSNSSPASDAFMLGAKFSNFEYRFTHFSLLAAPDSNSIVGAGTHIPAKYVAMHRASFRPSWGEISYWEAITYSNRSIDIAYLNPLTFMKSLEHALRDRDNSMMGMDLTLRPIDGLQIKGSYILDDIIFSNIGTGFWSNKAAMNIAAMYSTPWALDFGFEYSRIEPYTFSHFNYQNSYTNDRMMFGTSLLPNSESYAMNFKYWYGGRYPIYLNILWQRHGDNILDSAGKVIVKNVGGDPLQTINWDRDNMKVTFLEGVRKEIYYLEFGGTLEIVRGFNLGLTIINKNTNGNSQLGGRINFSFEDF